MDSGSLQGLICGACSRSFAQPNAYSNHIRSCRVQKKRTANALETAQDIYRNKKIHLSTTNEAHIDQAGESSQQATDPEELGTAVEVSVSQCPLQMQSISQIMRRLPIH